MTGVSFWARIGRSPCGIRCTNDVRNDLHRIDPAVVKEQITAVGFVFDGDSDALRNPDDDVTQPMFAEGIRGKTDRFIYRFRKP